jgi:chromosome segregation ATPase
LDSPDLAALAQRESQLQARVSDLEAQLEKYQSTFGEEPTEDSETLKAVLRRKEQLIEDLQTKINYYQQVCGYSKQQAHNNTTLFSFVLSTKLDVCRQKRA